MNLKERVLEEIESTIDFVIEQIETLRVTSLEDPYGVPIKAQADLNRYSETLHNLVMTRSALGVEVNGEES